MNKFYITTAIDYVNSSPHVGTAYEKIGADALARWKRLCGYNTFFLMGQDEHSTNVEKKAVALGLGPLDYCNKMEEEFRKVWAKLNVSFDDFIRTTSPIHKETVQKIFNRINSSGDIYKGTYKGWYCVSCEAYKKETELIDGKCPNHKSPPKWIEEENYFFKLTNYRDKLLNYVQKNPTFIMPNIRRNEILNVLQEGLDDISISRASTKWGVPIPQDESHVIYVWFDALINYLSGVGFEDNTNRFSTFWPADVHVIGKDITRFHCIIWPAMLLSAGLPLPKTIFGHGFVYVKGQKMSKTLGTVIDPSNVADKYGADALRYFLLREIAFDNDGDFTWEKLIERYNSDLANDLGNLLHRTLNMINKYQDGVITVTSEAAEPVDDNLKNCLLTLAEKVEPLMENLAFHNALAVIWEQVNRVNRYIEETSPWTLSKNNKKSRLQTVLYNTIEAIRILATLLSPFIPTTSTKIWEQIGLNPADMQTQKNVDLIKTSVTLDTAKRWDYIKTGTKVKKGEPLFPRIDEDGSKVENP